MPRILSSASGLVLVALLACSSTLLLGSRIGSVRAGTAVRMELPALARSADLIVEARVLSAHGALDPSGRIDTEYALRVERTLWGEPLATRTVRIPGGVLPDGRGMVVAGVPRLTPGEEVLLFLSSATETGMRMPTGLGQGKFSVVRDLRGRRSLVRAPEGLALVDGRTGRVSEADSALRFDYAATFAELEAALSTRRVEEAERAKAAADAQEER